MFENFSPSTMLAIKKYAYWLWLLLALSMPFNYWMAQDSAHPAFWAFSLVIAVFGIGPLLDMLFGRDPANPDEETQTPQLLGQGYYVLLTLATVPVLIGTLVWAAGVFVAFQEWGWLGRLGWILSMGTVMGAVGIVVAHELIHKDSALEQAAGGILLAAVCYAGFKVEHVRGHHVHVSTPEDASSARFGQSVYQFLPHAYKYNFLNAWRLEAVRLRKKGLPVFGWQNELIWWYLLSLARLGVRLAGDGFLPWPSVRRGDPAGDHQLRRALRPASAKGRGRALRADQPYPLLEQQLRLHQPGPVPSATAFRPSCLRQTPLSGPPSL